MHPAWQSNQPQTRFKSENNRAMKRNATKISVFSLSTNAGFTSTHVSKQLIRDGGMMN
jgi:hypothetical protein